MSCGSVVERNEERTVFAAHGDGLGHDDVRRSVATRRTQSGVMQRPVDAVEPDALRVAKRY
jgi:hypothetical protein